MQVLPLKGGKTITAINLICRSIFSKLNFISRLYLEPKLCYCFPQQLTSVALLIQQAGATVMQWCCTYMQVVDDIAEATQATTFTNTELENLAYLNYKAKLSYYLMRFYAQLSVFWSAHPFLLLNWQFLMEQCILGNFGNYDSLALEWFEWIG